MCKFCIHLFNLNLRYMASRIHTHTICNAVPLVWSSLRLAPVTQTFIAHTIGVSTNTPVLNADGLTGRVLLIFSAVISLLVVVVLTAAVACELHGLFSCICSVAV